VFCCHDQILVEIAFKNKAREARNILPLYLRCVKRITLRSIDQVLCRFSKFTAELPRSTTTADATPSSSRSHHFRIASIAAPIERILFERASANVLRLNGRLFLIPDSNETRDHLTTGNAKFYKKQLEELLQTAPQRAM
jgi:hypothetical protein